MDAAAVATPRRYAAVARQKRGERVSRMFDRIAPTYDVLNRLLSARSDVRWRKRLVQRLALQGHERVLDACTGTGDQAIALLAGGAGEVWGADFAPEMIRLAREKLAREKVGDRVALEVADVSALPHPDGFFDAVTVSFGVRNFEDLDAGLRELARVVRPGGKLAILELSRPRNPVLRGLYNLYFMIVLPLIGNLVSGGAENAYAYLPRSVQAWPGPDALARRIREAGFAQVECEPLSLGIACIHLATR